METRACKYLDYDENKYTSDCNISGLGVDKFVWERKDFEGKLQLCQFCSKRGRLNSPTACTSERHAQCGDYEEAEIKVIPRRNKDR